MAKSGYKMYGIDNMLLKSASLEDASLQTRGPTGILLSAEKWCLGAI